MNIFKYLDYKIFLKKQIKEHRSRYGYKTELARAAGCRASYFSQVLNGDFHLSAEHALGIALNWKLGPAETDYWIHLVHYARSSTPDLKRYYESVLKKLSAESERSVLRGNAQEFPDSWKSLFYSSWHYTAIHDLTTFPGGQTADSIVRHLELPHAIVADALRALESMALIERRGSDWHAKVIEIVVPPGSHYQAQHIHHWTARAAQDALVKRGTLESFHKCWVFGISPEDYRRLHELIIEHIQRCQKVIPHSGREKLACMNLHLFGV